MEVMLKEIGEIITGNTPSKNIKEFWDSNDICFIKPDIIADFVLNEIYVSNEYISECARKRARIVSKGAVFVTCIGSIGKIGIAGEGEYAFNQQINAIVPNSKINPRYLAYNLFFNKQRLIAVSNAPVVPIINKSQFGEFVVNIEQDISKQSRIVYILDKLSLIINNRKEELNQLDIIIKARFVEMFGDIKSEEKYKNIKLKEICNTVSGGTPSTRVKEYYNGEIPWITTVSLGDNYINGGDAKAYITKSAIDNSATKLIPAGNILFGTRVGVGKSSINMVDLCTNQDIVAIIDIDTNKFDRLFIKRVLDMNQPYYDSLKKGATILGITSEDLKDTIIPNVPIEVQNKFSAFVIEIDKSKLLAASQPQIHIYKTLTLL